MSEPMPIREETEAIIAKLRKGEGIATDYLTSLLTALLALAFDPTTSEKYIERAAISEELRREALARLSGVERERDEWRDESRKCAVDVLKWADEYEAAQARLSEVEKALEHVNQVAKDDRYSSEYLGMLYRTYLPALQHKDQQG